jgi:hypothetical protein
MEDGSMPRKNRNDYDINYRVKGVVDASEIPGWARKPSKWNPVIEELRQLNYRKSLVLSFDTYREARNAANTIRDRINLRHELGKEDVISTRVVRTNNGDETDLYLTRYHTEDVQSKDSGK